MTGNTLGALAATECRTGGGDVAGCASPSHVLTDQPPERTSNPTTMDLTPSVVMLQTVTVPGVPATTEVPTEPTTFALARAAHVAARVVAIDVDDTPMSIPVRSVASREGRSSWAERSTPRIASSSIESTRRRGKVKVTSFPRLAAVACEPRTARERASGGT